MTGFGPLQNQLKLLRISAYWGSAEVFRLLLIPSSMNHRIGFKISYGEWALAEHPSLAGATYSLADINVLSSAERHQGPCRSAGLK
jgi:hypothetical protein